MRWGGRSLFLVGAAAVMLLGPVATASAQTVGPCIAIVDGADVNLFSDSGSAHEVDADGSFVMAAQALSGQTIEAINVNLEFSPIEISVFDDPNFGGSQWTKRFPVNQYDLYGVGLYRAVATAQLQGGGTCSAAMWFEVTGRSPFTTVAGITASVVILAGVALAVRALHGARVGRKGLGSAIAGGALVGGGALVLAQQSGIMPIQGDTVALWVAAPGLGSAVIQQVVARVSRREDRPLPGVVGAGRDTYWDQPDGAPADAYSTTRVGGQPAGPVQSPGGTWGPPTAGSTGTATTGRYESWPEQATSQPGAAPAPQAPKSALPPQAPPPPQAPDPPPASQEPPPVEPIAGTVAPGDSALSVEGAQPESIVLDEPKDEASVPVVAGIYQPEKRIQDPPRSAYARLECPDVILAAIEFDLVVGLSELPSPDVIGEKLERPASSFGPYFLSVQVVADGFVLRDGESWRVDLPVTADAPYPDKTLHLTAQVGSEAVKPRAIRAMFSVDGQTIGMAYRSVVVARSKALLEEANAEPQEAGVDLSVPTTKTAPDLTVQIVQGEDEGRLMWTFETPHQGVEIPLAPIGTDIGDGQEPRVFARQLVDRVNAREGKPGLYHYLIGIARSVADEMPDEFWTVLKGVAERTGGKPPSVLILSEEPYIPWELAETRPLIDESAPPFLSAQTVVGRWVLGHRRPKMPPPSEASATPMAVIWGVYNKPGWSRLVEAEAEAAAFGTTYKAVTVNAAAREVLDCLEGQPPANLMHFAVHGIYDPAGIEDGLVLTDGHVLDPMEVKGSTFKAAPFVFLNACQVGGGNKILGDYAGLADSFLYAGAAGVVAPLWSVKDTVAKELAVKFYERIFAGEPVGEVLRSQRARFIDSDDPVSATYLAYQYFGHPKMKFTRTEATKEGQGWPSASIQMETPSESATS
jgi:hypothetical protein